MADFDFVEAVSKPRFGLIAFSFLVPMTLALCGPIISQHFKENPLPFMPEVEQLEHDRF